MLSFLKQKGCFYLQKEWPIIIDNSYSRQIIKKYYYTEFLK